MGDAAHTMFPFYGQGLNTSIEDCWMMDKLIDENRGDWKKINTKF